MAKKYVFLPDKRYLRMNDPNAYCFLSFQCIGIAYAWIEEVNAGDFNMQAALEWYEPNYEPKIKNKEGICKLLEDLTSRIKRRHTNIENSSQSTNVTPEPSAQAVSL
eukprot:CAMPEP_0194239740 /NCGR_PEP_ID=MMETSP0158-20130606/6116_1 /TAXON_ID=33649 /ORGANISM="Thalassionema nitzschioides, Strain L26-B" /LENGTH=106 /DNA_ID=CAMNT_0038974283 /DNA_START=226 /DNA_END=543 /DNA_ORIENTATION=-